MKHLLLAEDDLALGEVLVLRLRQQYRVTWTKSFSQARALIEDFKTRKEPLFDVCVLDVDLQDGSGFEIAEILKSQVNIPFLFLTAQSDPESRLKGFELGAEEFIPKPFHLKELLIRLDHVLHQHIPSVKYRFGNIIIDFEQGSLQSDLGTIDYPPTSDLKVLQLLMDRYPRTVSRDEIIDHVWGNQKIPNLRSIDNIILRLRSQLGDQSENFIRSVRGIGYVWQLDPAKCIAKETP